MHMFSLRVMDKDSLWGLLEDVFQFQVGQEAGREHPRWFSHYHYQSLGMMLDKEYAS